MIKNDKNCVYKMIFCIFSSKFTKIDRKSCQLMIFFNFWQVIRYKMTKSCCLSWVWGVSQLLSLLFTDNSILVVLVLCGFLYKWGTNHYINNPYGKINDDYRPDLVQETQHKYSRQKGTVHSQIISRHWEHQRECSQGNMFFSVKVLSR